MGGLIISIRRKAVWVALLGLAFGPCAAFAQTTNLAYQVANLTEDVRILGESIRSMRVELDNMRRENNQLREQVNSYETRVGNSMDQLATVGQLNLAVDKAVKQLEQRDEKMKNEIVLQVTKQITDFAGSVKNSLSQIPAAPAKQDPGVLTTFHNNFPQSGTLYIVRSGDTLSGIATKFNSTVDWVQNANQIPSPRHLQVGLKIFVPFKEDQ